MKKTWQVTVLWVRWLCWPPLGRCLGDGCSGIGNLNGFDVYSSARAFGAMNTVPRGLERLGGTIFEEVCCMFVCFTGNDTTLAGETKLKHLFSLSLTLAVASAVMAGDWNRILLGTRRFWRKLCRAWFSRNHQRLGSSAYLSRSHCLNLVAASTVSGFDWDYVPVPSFPSHLPVWVYIISIQYI